MARAPHMLRVLALGVLGRFAGLLEPVLLLLLFAWVTGQEAGPLQRHPKLGFELGQRPSDTQAEGAGLAGDAAAVQRPASML